jgi:hypothetical protein
VVRAKLTQSIRSAGPGPGHALNRTPSNRFGRLSLDMGDKKVYENIQGKSGRVVLTLPLPLRSAVLI